MTYRNLTEMLRLQAVRLGPRPAVRFKRHGVYHDLSWEQYRADVVACAAALAEAGVQPGDRVGMLSENRLEWLIVDMGILAAGAVNVPPHAPLTARQVHYQLANAGVCWLFVSAREQLAKALAILPELPAIKGIVVFDARDLPESLLDRVITWAGFLQRGRNALSHRQGELSDREAAIRWDDLATIIYTSGTTGNPKGVVLTHGNLMSNVRAMLQVSPVEPDDVALGWLPLSHIYARTCDHYKSVGAGTTLALAESAETLVANLEEVQPTHFNSVPRFYEKVLSAVASCDSAESGHRLRKIFGPRMKWMGAGGAPLPVPVAEAYAAAGLLIHQGYGLTETAPVISFNRVGRCKIGTVGEPLPGVEVKIGPDGEVLTRGLHVMKCYWDNPEATAATIEDGWLHTGDLGKLDGDGHLVITGRKKELLVLSNGKKVVPNHVEGLLLGDPCIDQAVVCGEGRNFLTALIVPHWSNVREALHAEGVAIDSMPSETLAKHPAVNELLRERIAGALKDVASWEHVKKFVILPQQFSVANDELTVSLKLRRNVIVSKYRSALDELYQ
jgi:long-chain acyl-CoA synthetase